MKLLLAALVVRTVARSLRSGVVLPDDASQSQRAMPLNFNLADCYADPNTCGGAMDSLSNLSKTIIDKVILYRNETQKSIQLAMNDFASCTPEYTTTAKQYRTSLRTWAKEHKQCRDLQVAAHKALKFCEASRDKLGRLAHAACDDAFLKQNPTPGVCKAPTQTSMKTLQAHFRNLKKQFFTWNMMFVAKRRECIRATSEHSKKKAECEEKQRVHDNRKIECDAKLTALDEAACEWAQKAETRRKNYYPCYNNALKSFNLVKASIKETKDANKEEYVLGMRMKCMAEAVDSVGKVDIAKMRACHGKKIDASLLLVAVPKQPERKLYSSPRIYPSSRAYYREVYKILPWHVRKQVRAPTLCLGWKGGCAARSTFAGAPVYLKLNNKYCGLDGSSAIRCTGNLRKHRFAFVGHDTKCGHATLVAVNEKGQHIGNCRFAPDVPFPQMKCPPGGKPLAPTRAHIPDGNPPMIGRSNTVKLKLAPLTKVNLKLSDWSSWNLWDRRVKHSCGTAGALVGLRSEHDNRGEDRRWKHRCAYFPDGVGSMSGQFYGHGWLEWAKWQNSWDNPLYMECSGGSVLVGHKSKHNNKKEDRRFQFPCRKLPSGMKEDERRDWDSWTAWDASFTKQCSGGEVLVGVESKHNNGKEDRIWKSRCARISPRTPQLTSFKVVYAAESY